MNIVRLLLFISLSSAFSMQAWGYGESYLAETRETDLSGLSLSARLGNDLSNPYLDTYSGHFGLHYFWSERFGAQAFYQQSWSELSQLNRNIERDFDMNGLATRNRKPQDTYRAGLELVPLFGRLNFFSQSVINFQLHLASGAGVRSFDFGENATLGYWSLAPQFQITQSVWAQLVFQQNTVGLGESNQFTESELQLGTRITF